MEPVRGDVQLQAASFHQARQQAQAFDLILAVRAPPQLRQRQIAAKCATADHSHRREEDKVRVFLRVDVEQVLADVDVRHAAGPGLDTGQSDIVAGAGEESGSLFCHAESGADVGWWVDDQQPVGSAGQLRQNEERVGRGFAFAVEFELFEKLGDFHQRGVGADSRRPQ